jgi:hypothetical protein
MLKKNVLIMCASNPQNDPRPNRMINYLKDHYQVTVIGLGDVTIEGVEYIPLARIPKRNHVYKITRAINLLTHNFENSLWTRGMRELRDRLLAKEHMLIITHDLTLLPLALSIQKKAKVLLDAREFYPRNFDDHLLWRLLFRPMNEYLCNKYLRQCDRIITVSDGIAQEYQRVYGIHPEVFMSLPVFHNLLPTQTHEKSIKIIHHGWASMSRKIELMIEMMDYVDERFSLDFMLLPGPIAYWNKLTKMASNRKNVRFIPPVSMQELVKFTNIYDIGLFLCKPTNFNLKFTLPNKLFEFIQARLAVGIGPSIEMKKIVEKYDCGVVSEDFEPHSLAEALNGLRAADIMYYKEQSHKASLELNAETYSEKINTIVRELVEG